MCALLGESNLHFDALLLVGGLEESAGRSDGFDQGVAVMTGEDAACTCCLSRRMCDPRLLLWHARITLVKRVL
jgi:hypothetical protein